VGECVARPAISGFTVNVDIGPGPLPRLGEMVCGTSRPVVLVGGVDHKRIELLWIRDGVL